jgi:ferredoxin
MTRETRRAVRIKVDRDLCELHGQCAFTAPDLFHIDDDGELQHAEEVPEDWLRMAQQAAAVCPTAAITVELSD